MSLVIRIDGLGVQVVPLSDAPTFVELISNWNCREACVELDRLFPNRNFRNWSICKAVIIFDELRRAGYIKFDSSRNRYIFVDVCPVEEPPHTETEILLPPHADQPESKLIQRKPGRFNQC